MGDKPKKVNVKKDENTEPMLFNKSNRDVFDFGFSVLVKAVCAIVESNENE